VYIGWGVLGIGVRGVANPNLEWQLGKLRCIAFTRTHTKAS